MTTGEKLALLRKRAGYTQDYLSEVLGVSRQSISKWEMDVAFPETEKLIKLSRLYDCSIDYILMDSTDDNFPTEGKEMGVTYKECFQFIRECGYFFLATATDNMPSIRPMGQIYANEKCLCFVTYKEKRVYEELLKNPYVEIASLELGSNKWIRIRGRAQVESSEQLLTEIMDIYPSIKRRYKQGNADGLVIFKVLADKIDMF